MRSVCAISFLLALSAIASPARADGKRDLEDGVAFYENLDTDRALERLAAASKASDLPPKDRARAFLYLGMVHFENGVRVDAEKAWKSAFELDKNVEVPKGTSPKTIEAIEASRSTSAKPPVKETTDEPGDRPKDNATPDINANAQQQQTTTSQQQTTTTQQETTTTQQTTDKNAEITSTQTPPETHTDDSSSTWIIIAAIGAAVVGAAVIGLVVATGGSDCEGGGGCASVTFR